MAAYTKFTNVETTLLKVNGTDYNTRVAAIETDVSTAEEDILALEAAEGKALKYVKVGTIDKDDTSGEATAMATTVPAGAVITQVILSVEEVFNSGDSDTIAVGISGTANKFLATSDITATTLGAYTKIQAYETGAEALAIYATWTGAGTAATTGSADIYVVYFEE